MSGGHFDRKGKYNSYRIITTVVNTALLLSFAMTAFFRVPFAFLDYEKAGILVFIENVLMLLFRAFIGTEVVQKH